MSQEEEDMPPVEERADDDLRADLASEIGDISRCLQNRDYVAAVSLIEGVFLDRLRLLAERQRTGQLAGD